ncbi:MAG TPA: hypothetical protein VFL59_00630, partial [Candidatus Nanopelagicales bacterium]|nr:hypothetical protein [Candidatus Nanopelagicales bacterium]
MAIEMTEPGVDGLPAVLIALRSWQRPDEVRVPLHPGDIGWFWRFGPEATAAAVRTWSDGTRLVAVGLYDDGVLRLATDPGIDRGSAHAIADGVWGRNGALLATRGTFSADEPGVEVVEVRAADGVRAALRARGWVDDEPWTPLVRDLAEPVPDPRVRIVEVGPDTVDDRVAVQRAAFDSSTFTADRWRAMAAGPAYADARCLVAYDDGVPVAAVTVWSAGPG